MRKNEIIKEYIEACKEVIFAVDKDYWDGENSSFEQRDKWKERLNDPLVYDGLICDSDETCEIVYLLKESTCSGYNKYKNLQETNTKWFPADRVWNFIQMTNDLVNDTTLRIEPVWPELCCWTSAFRNTLLSYIDLEKTFKKYENADYGVLKNTAIVNIKKTAGESSSEDTLLANAVTNYGSLIKQEVEILDPKIVLCGGTFENARAIWGQYRKKRLRLGCGAEYFVFEDKGKKLLFVQFLHPSASVKKELLFAYVKEVFKDLRAKKLIE